MLAPGCLAALVLFAVLLLPFVFANMSLLALEKLGLSPTMALLAVVGIILGGAVNIPIRRIPREEVITLDPYVMFGAGRWWVRRVRTAGYSVLAVNVGGGADPAPGIGPVGGLRGGSFGPTDRVRSAPLERRAKNHRRLRQHRRRGNV